MFAGWIWFFEICMSSNSPCVCSSRYVQCSSRRMWSSVRSVFSFGLGSLSFMIPCVQSPVVHVCSSVASPGGGGSHPVIASKFFCSIDLRSSLHVHLSMGMGEKRYSLKMHDRR